MFSIWVLALNHAHWMIVLVMPLGQVAPLGQSINKESANMYEVPRLTIGISLKERIQNLQMAGDLLASSPLASQFEYVFSNQLVPAI
jgi:hypothetical protein